MLPLIRTPLTIEVSSANSSNGAKVKVSVTDTGVGISSEQAQNLFHPFSQADSSISRRFGGTGLGLILSKKLAEALGGGLVLQKSIPGKGSCFEISIDAVDAEVSLPASGRDSSVAKGEIEGLRILLADDSKDNQVLISQILRLAHVEVEIANDGLEAIERASRENFDLVLMDVQMPKLDGHQATIRLRELGYKKPIVALTAHALKEDRDRSLSAGCDDYLTKPIDRKRLFATIARLGAARN
jgi:CheY-like chemotaxis protein